ncbi:hypothetical protein PMAYCL1PPCAC_19302, partial [Pristionchus mayeri]
NGHTLTLMDKWSVPTRLLPDYYWAATRGTLSVIFLGIVIYRRPGVYKQYQVGEMETQFTRDRLQYTVMFITFGGFALMLPVFMFNSFVALLVSIYDGGKKSGVDQRDYNASYNLSFRTSVFACSLSNHIATTTMNSNFCIGFVISLMRYLLFLYGLQMTWSFPFLLLAYIMFFGVIANNDCCELILEVPEGDVPIYYYSYLMFILIAAILVNIRTLAFLLRTRKIQAKEGTLSSNKKSNRDQLRLSLGFLLQSFAPFLSFGSFLVFMV